MKRILSIIIPALMLISSCAPKVVVSDEELAMIFRDAFLANAYLYDAKNIKIDTLQIYQPIFDKYGYTAEEVATTVGSFSRRKSARLSDVVERTIALLEQGEKHYKLEATIIDSIEAIARRSLTKSVYYEPLITFYDKADTINTHLRLDSLKPGSYRISFDYLVDSLDNNGSNYRFTTWVEGPDKEVKNLKRASNTSYLRKKYVSSVEREIEIDTLTHELHIHLAESYERKRTHHVTIKEFRVDFTPKSEVAIDSLYRRKLDIRVFADDFFKLQPQDSLQLPAI